ncbi:MAG TPA: fused MFS/spermidine synthase [Thermoanaerobaculia bacterium]|nr:fused MFS/spermidine synthase [Thermoanaerobaculia bacterium]
MRLSLSAFVTGFATLGLEIAALRLLAPSFGSNLLVFSNVIGVILAGLAAGYAAGGRLADRRPDARVAGLLQLAAGVLILVLPLLSRPFLLSAQRALAEGSASLFLRSLAAAALLILPPTLLLGAVSPFLVRLRAHEVAEVGRASGHIGAVATAGSLLGTFVPTLVTVPLLGTAATLVLIGVLLIVAAPLLLGRRGVAAMLVLAAVPLVSRPLPRAPGVLEARESPYQSLRVEERSDGARVLRIDEGLGDQSTYRPGERLSGTMYDAFLLLDAAKDGGVRRVADLGLAGGTIAHVFREELPSVAVTGVELDPDVIALGRRWFTLNDPNLTVVNDDARIFLARGRSRFDAIAVDVFRPPHVPFPCTTREFFTLARARLAAGGALMMNVVALRTDDPIVAGIANTAAAVFPEVWVWNPPFRANDVLIASNTPGLRDRLARNPVPPDVASLRDLVVASMQRVAYDPAGPLFTDDRAPVELLSDLLFVRFLRQEERANPGR